MQSNLNVRPEQAERKVRVVQDARTTTGDRLRKVSRGLWVISIAGQFALLFRFLLRMIEANPENPFARLVFSVSDTLMIPFRNLVTNPTFGGIVLDAEAVIAMLVYSLATWLLVEALWVIFYGQRKRAVIVEESRQE